jgi:hypothetical protein
MSDETAAASGNANLLKFARFGVMGTVLLVFVLAAMGLAQVTTGDVGHGHTAMLGLAVAFLSAVLIFASGTDDSALKGMGGGLAFAWLLQYGLAEMGVLGNWVAWVHAPLAIAMAMHGMAMLRRFPSDA